MQVPNWRSRGAKFDSLVESWQKAAGPKLPTPGRVPLRVTQDHERRLTGEERSSSLPRPALAAPASMERFVPHPNKVTVPVMAVTTKRRLIGLAWDPLQKWDGIRTRPSAFFASPNWLDGQNNHLMGLFVPAVPDGA